MQYLGWSSRVEDWDPIKDLMDFGNSFLHKKLINLNRIAQLFLVTENAGLKNWAMQLFPPTYVLQLFGAFVAVCKGENDKNLKTNQI